MKKGFSLIECLVVGAIIGIVILLFVVAFSNNSKSQPASKGSNSAGNTLFKVGDKIIMNKKADSEYSGSKEGSIGVIQNISGDTARVRFSKLTGGESTPADFDVRLDCMDSLEPNKDSIKELKEIFPDVFDNGQNVGWIDKPYWKDAAPLIQRWINEHPHHRVVTVSSDSTGYEGKQTGWFFVYEEKFDLPYRTNKTP